MVNNIYLVGGDLTILKHDGVSNSWDDYIPNWMEKYNSCSKPPTSYVIFRLNPWNLPSGRLRLRPKIHQWKYVETLTFQPLPVSSC